MLADTLPPRLARCQRALAASRDGFWERDLGTRELWMSPSMLAMVDPEALQQGGGDGIGEALVHPDDRSTHGAAIDAAIAQRGAFDCDVRLRQADGQWRWMRIRGQVWLSPDGEPEHLSGSVSDIHSEKVALLAMEAQHRALAADVRERTAGLQAALALAEQRRQEAEAANAAKSRFLAHMSHEIRTPLNGVLGLTELTLNTPLTAQQRRYLQTAQESGESLLQVISDVLDLSRIESGTVDLRPQPFDPVRAMAETLRSLMPMSRNPQVVMLFDWEGEPGWVLGDEGSLRQIVGNLLGNAIKFTEQGQVALHGRAQRRPDGPVDLEICVSDTGPGIPSQRRAEVFEPFVQGDDRLARQHGGAGLGLAIANRLAEAMDAELCLECPLEGGSRFTLRVRLPAADAQASEALEAHEPPAAAEQTLPAPPPGEAWLVYHQEAAGAWLARRLQRLGWRTTVVLGLGAAISLAQANGVPRPDLVMVAEPALRDIATLQPLRQTLPDAEIQLLVRPHWNDSNLEAESGALRIGHLVAPLTPAQLAAVGTGRARHRETPHHATAPELQPQAEVLLVEDNPVNQLVGQEFLRALGLQVRLADDGGAALSACIERSPQLVLMDLEMPGMDGLQAARELRALQRAGRWNGAPIVALTAHASAADRAACRAAGMDAVLTKPLSLQTLRKRLARWLAVV